MASVKASVFTPPVEENTILPELPELNSKINIHVIIYILMGITILLFVKKLIVAACRRRHEQGHGAKLE